VETVRLDDGLFHTQAPNGLTVLSESLPSVRSVALGVWVQTGSAHEPRAAMGVSHLLEHMVFKGSERRSAKELALALETRGGSLDAYTSRDHTCYQAHVLESDLALAADVLTDLVRRPLLRASDLAVERNVVLEEINGVLDTPDDLVFELHAEALWADHPYGYAILGTPETVAGLTDDDLHRAHAAGYYPGNCIVAAAGRVDHQRLLDVLAVEGWFDDGAARAQQAPVARRPARHGLERTHARDTTQAHVVFGAEAFPHADPRRYALAMVTNAFGGGMSSRLFQRIREDLGLAYAVYAFHHLYRATGQIGVYVGTQPSTAAQAVEAIRHEFAELASAGLPADEVADAKAQLRGQVILSLESTTSRMGRLATFAVHGEPYRPVDEVLAAIDGVTPADVAALCGELFQPERQTVVHLGPQSTNGRRAAAPTPT